MQDQVSSAFSRDLLVKMHYEPAQGYLKVASDQDWP